ncbi:hypothetical protein [Lacticaseibacillus hulanensis]|uniref:hypothetical protein n=1 Tax=Lacticaseibacillus hulanensis TaxID=2493111 RepID=UPI000FDA7258|nr:hypothetical protein [Lacticaseibacillus hulanensis]
MKTETFIPKSMSYGELNEKFYDRRVQFKLKNGKTRTVHVEDIENEDDQDNGILFMASEPEDDVWLEDVVSVTVGNDI